MNEVFKIEHFDVKVNDTVILSDFSCEFKGSICVLGESGSGKTCLLKELVQATPLEYVSKTEFYFGEIKKVSNWKEFLDYSSRSFEVQSFLDQFFQNGQDISLKCYMLEKVFRRPNYFFLDDTTLLLSDFSLFCEFLKSLSIAFFFVTNDVEKTVLFDYLYVLKNGSIAMEGKTSLVLKEEKLMKVLGFSLPFYVNLSKQLGYYGLLSDIYYNKEDMEVALWQSK